MPIVKPRLDSESLNGAVSAAFTRSGSGPLFTPGHEIPWGSGAVGGDVWDYNGDHFSPQPGTFQVDGFKGRLDRVKRVFISELDNGGLDVSGNLLDISQGQTIDIGGVVGTVGAMSFWHWPRTDPWRLSNVYHVITLQDEMDLKLLDDGAPYAIGFL